MFGALFLLFIFFAALITLIRNVRDDIEGRRDFKNSFTNTYIAYDGCYRDLDTGKYRSFSRRNGDIYMRGDGIQERNISQEKRNAEYQYYKDHPSPNRTTCFYENEPKQNEYNPMVKRGGRYKDLKTGEIYVIREDKTHVFYVDLNDKVIRYTDFFRKGRDNSDEEEAVRKFQESIDKAKANKYWKMDPTLAECLNHDGRDHWD